MPIERIERPSTDEYRVDMLRDLFPEVFADGSVNFGLLRELLDREAEVREPGGQEHYGLNWPGKQVARRQAAKPPTATLRSAPGEGVDEATTQNLLVVGDNLEVLRVLQKSYAGRVKLIYIDPPYNTGNDFIYKDDFKEPIATYLEATSQADFAGLLTSNPRSGGRFHSNWLSMIWPRLFLARNLLRDDGVMFISIDDHEAHNLRLVVAEIFGEENIIASFVWQKKYSRDNRPVVGTVHEYIMLVARDAEAFARVRNLLPPSEDSTKVYRNPNNDPRGRWRPVPLTAQAGHATPNQFYEIVGPTGVSHKPPEGRCWSVVPETFEEMRREGRIWFGKDGTAQPNLIRYLTEIEGFVPWTWLPSTEVGHTDEAKKELYALLGKENRFETPKPTRLLRHFIQMATKSDSSDIVMDFFAGTGTFGDAVLQQNRIDGGNRRFILVQLPEATGHTDYKTIAEITKTRLRSAAKKALDDAGTGKLPIARAGQDNGFRVLNEDKSNVQRWVPYEGLDPAALPELFRSREGLLAGWKVENVLIEVMLLEGYPLDSRQTQSPDFLENVVYLVQHESIPARLLVCLDGEIAETTVEKLAGFEKDVFLCREAALTDTLKVRVADVLHRVKTL